MKLIFLFLIGIPQIVVNSTKVKTNLIGVYSKCNNSGKLTELNIMANVYSKSIKEAIETSSGCPVDSFCYRRGWQPLNDIQEFDVCFNSTKLMNVVLDILLESENSSIDYSVPTNNENEIVLIFTYTNQYLFELLGNLIYLQDFPLTLVTLNPNISPSSIMSNNVATISQNIVNYEFPYLLKYFDQFQRNRIGILYLKNDNFIDGIYFTMYEEFVIFLKQQSRLCYFNDIVNMTNEDNIQKL